MIVRPTTQKEKAKHSNMAYVIDLGHSKQWFTEKALVELLGRMQIVVNDNNLLPVVSGSALVKVENAYIEDADTVDSYDVTGRVRELWITESEFDSVKCINN